MKVLCLTELQIKPYKKNNFCICSYYIIIIKTMFIATLCFYIYMIINFIKINNIFLSQKLKIILSEVVESIKG